jgi:hypothetical protein
MLPQRVGDDPQMLLFPDMPSASSANEANICIRPGDGQVSHPFTSWPNDKVPDVGRQHREFDRRIDSRAEESLGTVHSPALHAKGKQHEGGERRQFEVEQCDEWPERGDAEHREHAQDKNINAYNYSTQKECCCSCKYCGNIRAKAS